MGKEDISDKDKVFIDAIGQKATVHREDMRTDRTIILDRMLCDVALKMQDFDEQLKHYRYQGSAAVHIFAAPTVNHIAFGEQVGPLLLYNCPEILAAKAFDALVGKMKQVYGHKRPILRSGF